LTAIRSVARGLLGGRGAERVRASQFLDLAVLVLGLEAHGHVLAGDVAVRLGQFLRDFEHDAHGVLGELIERRDAQRVEFEAHERTAGNGSAHDVQRRSSWQGLAPKRLSSVVSMAPQFGQRTPRESGTAESVC
jgi:hypothetical protein